MKFSYSENLSKYKSSLLIKIAFFGCFVFLLLTGYAAYFFPAMKAQKQLRVLYFEKRAPSFRTVFVDGAITFFIGIYATVVAIYINGCSPFWTDKIGLTKDSNDQDNETECAAAGAVLAMAGWGGIMLKNYGQGQGWFYNNQATSVNSKRDLVFASNPPSDGMYNLLGNLHMDISQQFDEQTDNILKNYNSAFHENITFTSQLFSNSTGEFEAVGHLISFYNGATERIHVAVMPEDSIHDAMVTLQKFDGSTQVFSDNVQLLNDTKQSLEKRDSSNFWVSFTGWGGDTGYIADLLNWDEFSKAGRDMAFKDSWFTLQVQGCTNSYYCFALKSKMCAAAGFSQTMGINDAEVGEIYYNSFGGLDNDCVEA